MNEKIDAVTSAADNTYVLRGHRVTSGRRMVVNSGRIIVHVIVAKTGYMDFSSILVL